MDTTEYLKLQKEKYEYRQMIKEVFMIKPINPIAKALAHHRKRKAIVPNKKSEYNRNKEKENAKQFYIPKDQDKEEDVS